ncbi:MAG: AsnC family transcriptional regulator [Proteobacteria bacterium]|nr:MAG: AsnC family transcriptional regulator [Pseudomonadota bacterium]
MTVTLDALDVKILELLQQDVTLPVADLAERVGSSKSVCWRRIQRLVDTGIIQSRVAILDPKKIGLDLMVFAHVKMNRHSLDVLPRFVEAVRRYPQVMECHTLMGDVDFLLKIVVTNVEEYEDFFWHKLSRIEGVQEVSSSISLTKFVYKTDLPLGQLKS